MQTKYLAEGFLFWRSPYHIQHHRYDFVATHMEMVQESFCTHTTGL